ncbi:MAG: exosortase A [Nitrospiraceae bacterium]
MTRILWAILAVIVVVVYWDTFSLLIHTWETNPDYSHGFLVLILAAYLCWTRRQALHALPLRASAWGIVPLATGLAVFVLGTIGQGGLSQQRYSFLVVLLGLVLLLFGKDHLRLLLFPIGFLIFMIPLPGVLQSEILFPLQLFAAKTATTILFVLGIPVLREGTIIQLAGATLEVAEACSGIRSLLSLMAVGTIYAYFAGSGTWNRLVIVLCSVPIAILTNALRIAGTGLLAHLYGTQVAEGFYHHFSGLVMFVLAFLLFVGVATLLSSAWKRSDSLTKYEIAWERAGLAKIERNNASGQHPGDVRGPVPFWSVITANVLLFCAWSFTGTSPAEIPVLVKKPFAEFPVVLENEWAGRDLPVESAVVEKLQVADYLLRMYVKTTIQGNPESRKGSSVTLYLAYVQSTAGGAEYHSPKLCLPGSGWNLVTVDTATVAPPTVGSISINKVLVQKGLDQQMVLYWYQDRGRILASENWQKFYSVWDLLVSHRTDGVLVRISVPVVTTEDEAYEEGRRFLYALWPILPEYMPSPESMPIS